MDLDQFLGIQYLTPIRFNRYDIGSEAACHFRHTETEEAVDPDDRGIAGLQQV
jgi:hypothetical protein